MLTGTSAAPSESSAAPSITAAATSDNDGAAAKNAIATSTNTITSRKGKGLLSRRCRQCRSLRRYTSFPVAHHGKGTWRAPDGSKRHHTCKLCVAAALPKRVRLTDEGRKIAKQRWNRTKSLRSNFGITVEQYDAMLLQQGGVCAICGERCASGKRLAVDHDHATGAVRDLLCGHCNLGLGNFKDNPERLAKAIRYLDRHMKKPRPLPKPKRRQVTYVRKGGGKALHYQRAVPRDLQERVGQKVVTKPLLTSDPVEAHKRATVLNTETEAAWNVLRASA